MRKWGLVVILAMLVCCLGCGNVAESKTEALSVEEKLVGEWGNGIFSFIFNDRNVIMADIVSAIGDEEKGELLWEVNFEHKPAHIDFIAVNYEEQKEVIWPGIIRFLTDDKIQLCFNREQTVLFTIGDIQEIERPTDFIDDNNISFVLDRQ